MTEPSSSNAGWVHASIWWGHLKRDPQMWLLDHPHDELPVDVLTAVLEARGAAGGAYFPASESGPSFTLGEDDADWIAALERPTTEFGWWDGEGRWNATSEDW